MASTSWSNPTKRPFGRSFNNSCEWPPIPTVRSKTTPSGGGDNSSTVSFNRTGKWTGSAVKTGDGLILIESHVKTGVSAHQFEEVRDIGNESDQLDFPAQGFKALISFG